MDKFSMENGLLFISTYIGEWFDANGIKTPVEEFIDVRGDLLIYVYFETHFAKFYIRVDPANDYMHLILENSKNITQDSVEGNITRETFKEMVSAMFAWELMSDYEARIDG